MAIILDGKLVADKIKNNIIETVGGLKKLNKRMPGLAVILIGDNESSKIYVNMKQKACISMGIASFVYNYEKEITESFLLKKIEELNNNDAVDGILVQLPLPPHISERNIIRAVDPTKDIDGFHPLNVGLSLLGEETFHPCTPEGIIKLLDAYNIEIESKRVVIVGRSNIVGKPLFSLLLHRNATVTICHSKTFDLKTVTRSADILIAAMGKPRFIKGTFIKEGAVVIDVGITRLDGKLFGDVDFDNVCKKASYITPVPGGIGPMTIAMLINNTIKAYSLHSK